MIEKLIVYFHLCLVLAEFTYPFWRSNFLDTYYLIFFTLLNMSWILLKNECLISYLYKISQDRNYTLGKNLSLFDFETVLGLENAQFMVLFLFGAFVVNLLIILYYTELKFSILALIFVFLAYIFIIRTTLSENIKSILLNLALILEICILIIFIRNSV